MSGYIETNITDDDFDSVFHYSDLGKFSTPDPSNRTQAASNAAYFDGTYHSTSAVNASISFNFTGSDIYVYGASGPSFGSIEIALDGASSASTVVSAYATNTTVPHLVYEAHNLSTPSMHQLVMKNLGPRSQEEGSSMLLDFVKTTVQLAPQGATLSNTSIEDRNMSRLTYSGTWNNNSDPLFSGGTTTYTNQDGASVSLNFTGTAVWIYGDQNNDHGFFDVTLDGKTVRSRPPNGCGGGFGKFCEKTSPGVQFWAAYLDDQVHNLTITNVWQGNITNSYFDLDRIVYTTPSTFLNLSALIISSDSSSTANNQNGTKSGDALASSPSTGSAQSCAMRPSSLALLLLTLATVSSFSSFLRKLI